jgi:hypothetical protein
LISALILSIYNSPFGEKQWRVGLEQIIKINHLGVVIVREINLKMTL